MENLTEQQILSAYSDFLSRIPYAANKSDSTVNNYCKILFEHELFRKYPECQINPEPLIDTTQLTKTVLAIQKLHFPQFPITISNVSSSVVAIFISTVGTWEEVVLEGRIQHNFDGSIYVNTRRGGTNYANIFDFLKEYCV